MTNPSQGNIRTPDVPLVIDGKQYTLRFSTRATMSLMDLWGITEQRELQAEMAGRGKTMKGMVDIIWSALQTHHRAMTTDDVIDLLDSTDISDVMQKVADAIERAVPDLPKAKGQAEPAPTL